MKREKVYYKCVREYKGELVSFCLGRTSHRINPELDKNFLLRYSQTKYTIPKYGVVFVFNSLKNAREFFSVEEDGAVNPQIWKVVGEKSKIEPTITNIAGLGGPQNSGWNSRLKRLIDFWVLSPEDFLAKYGKVRFDVPEGTVGLKKCILLKRIK